MKNKFRRFQTLFLVLAMIISVLGSIHFSAIQSYADSDDDYAIESCEWEDGGTYISCIWQKPEKSTKYRLEVFKDNKSILATTTSTNNRNVTSLLKKKGSGSYYFTVYPIKVGEKMKVTSDTFEVDDDTVDSVNAMTGKKPVMEKTTEPGVKFNGKPYALTGNEKWVKNTNGLWRFQTNDGVYVFDRWMEYDGKTYYFDNAGYMVTGWFDLKNKWYFFDQSGALLKNATTPDGFMVDANGVWIKDAKQVNAADPNFNTSMRSAKEISDCLVKMTETKKVGQLSQVKFSAKSSTVLDTRYNIPYEQWQKGKPVIITLIIQANNDYYYKNNCSFKLEGNGKIVGNQGSVYQHTLTIEYVPGTSIGSIKNLKMNGNVLSWDPADNAVCYKVKINVPEHFLKSAITAGNRIDLTPYEIDKYRDTMTVQICARASAEGSTDDDSNYCRETAVSSIK